MDDFFFQNPIFQGMNPEKLNFIMQFANKEKPKNMNEAMPFLLANMKQAKQQNIQFSNNEISLIAELLCRDLSDAEKARVKKIMTMMGYSLS